MSGVTYDHEVIKLDEGTVIEPYTTHWAEVGFVEKEPVRVAFVPRADFVKAMDEVIERCPKAVPDAVREELRQTAQTMPTFPMGTWVAPRRGCGCLVGEYLIARGVLDRELAALPDACVANMDGGPLRAEYKFDVSRALDTEYGAEASEALAWIGLEADSKVRSLLYRHAPAATGAAVAVILDTQEAPA